jgi:tRNA (guanine37-N1)-methyltransferase
MADVRMTLATGARVPHQSAEKVRRALSAQGLLSPSLEPLHEEGHVVFPLLGEFSFPGVETVQQDFPPRSSHPTSYTDLLELEEPLRKKLPKSFDVIGEIVALRLEPELLPHRAEIGEALRKFVPGVRVVALDRGVHGKARLRELEVIAGTPPLVTLYRENGITFKVNLETVYFSPRLAREHGRVAAQVQDGERILDLFCGFGPFALTSLRQHPKTTAVAVDANTQAIALLRENAARLKVESRLEAYAEDAEDFLGRPALFDRVIMNLPREGYKYLRSVGAHVKSSGRLHFYGLFHRDQRNLAATSVQAALGPAEGSSPWSLEEERVVHPYSPSTLLMAFTLEKHGEIKNPRES